jgi:succinate-semialdehyde dehydrogenase/glutarate-semialdehyde dehydrogenase
MAGNVSLLKHAPNVIGCGIAIEKLLHEAGFPIGAFQHLILNTNDIEQIIQADIVRGVTLTGSESAGSSVATLAGKHIKKSVLELGGSDPFIVLKDADTAKAAHVAVQSRFLNAGQACICAKRFIVVTEVFDDFIQAFQKEMQSYKQGDPLNPHIKVGPMARIDLAQKLKSQLDHSVAKGARILVGGEVSQCAFTPTLVDRILPEMVIFQEETFGPLAAILRVNHPQEAIYIANQSRYGLAASLWTNDIEQAYHLARKIEAGNVFVNSLAYSDSRLPFGGIKKSGFGRELSDYGQKEFTNIKTIVIEEA